MLGVSIVSLSNILIFYFEIVPTVLYVYFSFYRSPHSCVITAFATIVTRRLSQVEQELLTILKHMGAPPAPFSGIHFAPYFRFCVVCCRSLFALLLLVIVLSDLRLTASDYSFVFFKLFLLRKGSG